MLGGLEGWSEGLETAGIRVGRSGRPDLVVAPASGAVEALALGARAIVLEGRGGSRQLRRAGLSARTFLVRSRIERPQLFVPLADRRVAAYAVQHWSAAYTRRKRARNTLVRMLAARGVLPEIDPVVAIGFGGGAQQLPYVLKTAQAYGIPADSGWFMACGQGDALSRNVFHVFARGAAEPSWAVKFVRVAGVDDQFVRDEFGLRMVERAGSRVVAHAPRLLGRFSAGGVEASIETAAAGERLTRLLVAPGGERTKLQLVEDVAHWLLLVARETIAPPSALQPELDRLLGEVVPAWADRGVTDELVRNLPPLPAVLQHNDVGCWNVVVGSSGFTVVDWESAREHGLPLWDLVYFLTDALAVLDGFASPEVELERAHRLLRGDSPTSPLLFTWVARAAQELGIPQEAVGPIVTLGWLHHALSYRGRTEALDRVGGNERGHAAPVGRLAPAWLEDPALGVGWRAWHAA